MEEREAIRLAQQGNTVAFRHLFDSHKNRIFSLAYQYTKNAQDAEDILQDTFIKAFHALPQFRLQDATNFSSWLNRMGCNCSIDHLRRIKIKRDKYYDSDNLTNEPNDASDSNPERSGQIHEVRKTLEQTLTLLPSRQRMIFILRHYQQLNIKEIAEVLECSEGSVKKQLFRAFSVIRKEFRRLFLEADYEMQKV